MEETYREVRRNCRRGDAIRDRALKIPADVKVCRNLRYAPGCGKYHLLDVCRPAAQEGETLPVIVNVHGGGFVYGTKETYKHYAANLAQQGFAVVNFSYPLAPKRRFPAHLAEICRVLEWMTENAARFGLDLNNVFLAGDSAGAQLASHFLAVYSDPAFAALFDFRIPAAVKIRGAALNCGLYDAETLCRSERAMKWYVPEALRGDERVKVLKHITADYPPCYVMTCWYDFLRDEAGPFAELLQQRGAECEYHLWGGEGQTHMAHVFHCNLNLPEAAACNQAECAFFRRHLSAE